LEEESLKAAELKEEYKPDVFMERVELLGQLTAVYFSRKIYTFN
jgi:hypothetical protein